MPKSSTHAPLPAGNHATRVLSPSGHVVCRSWQTRQPLEARLAARACAVSAAAVLLVGAIAHAQPNHQRPSNGVAVAADRFAGFVD